MGTGDTEPPKGVDEERVNEIVNKALSARFKEQEKKTEKSNAAMIETIKSEVGGIFDEKLEAVEAKLKPPEKKPGDNKPDLKDDPAFKGLEKKQAELERENADLKKQRDSEKSVAREGKLRRLLDEALRAQGMDAVRATHAAGHLIDVKRSVKYSDDDDDAKPVYTDSDGAETDLASGVKSWLKSDDGKLYLPARGAGGSGGGPPSGGGGGGKKDPPPTKRELGDAMASQFLGVRPPE